MFLRRFLVTWTRLLLVAAMCIHIVPIPPVRAQTPTVSTSRSDVSARVSALKQEITGSLPAVMPAARIGVNPAGTSPVWSAARYHPLPQSNQPALPSLSVPDVSSTLHRGVFTLQELREMGLLHVAPVDRSSVKAANTQGFYDYMPYSFLGGSGAVEAGMIFSGGLMPGYQSVASMFPQVFDLNGFRRANGLFLDPAIGANALAMADQQIASTLGMLNSMPNGSYYNQMFGQWPFPQPSSSTSFSNLVQQDSALLGVFGYNSSSPFNFGTQFLLNYYGTQAPWDNTFSAFAMQAGAMPTQESFPPLQLEWLELAEDEEILYFVDTALSDLRIEAYGSFAAVALNDPLYLYYSQLLSDYLTAVFTSRPSYSELYDLAVEIGGWTTVEDPAVMAERYSTRLYYDYLTSVVQYETLLYLLTYPDDLQWVLDVQAFLDSIYAPPADAAIAQEDWYSDWYERWESAFTDLGNDPELTGKLDHLFTQYSGFEEYLGLNNDVRQLLLELEGHPAIEEMSDDTMSAFANQDVIDAVNTAHSDYQTQLSDALASSDAYAEFERYFERLGDLALTDEEYNYIEEQVFASLDGFTQMVYDAVDACYYWYGDACSPYTDPDVVAIYEQYYSDQVDILSLFHELYDLFWYSFYEGTDYETMEEESLARLETAVEPVESQIQAAQVEFNATVAEIPVVESIRTKRNQLAATLRGRARVVESVSNSAAYAKYAVIATDLDEKLTRMAELAEQLEGRSSLDPSTATLLLPLITH